jgi:hypothetical protein
MAVLTAIIVAVPPLKLVNTGHLTLVDSRLPVAVSFALLLLLVVLATDASRLRSLLGSRVLVLAGLASYSMFLVHDPIIRAVRAEDVASATLPGFLLTLGVVGTATAAATFVSYRLLERPSFELKRRLVAAPTAEPVQRVLDRLAGRVGEPHGVRFTVEAPAELRPVEASTLEPLVAPLLENAVVYGDAPFVVRAEEAGEALRVVVEDAGRGIDPSFVPRLFEPHARSEASSSVPGDGLGLATARRLARQHGGDVTFESPLEGGARFAVMIPRQEPPTAASRLKARLTRILPKRSEFEPQPTATRLVRA